MKSNKGAWIVLASIGLVVVVILNNDYTRQNTPTPIIEETAKESAPIVEEKVKEEVKVTLPSYPFPANGTILEQSFTSIDERHQAGIEVRTSGSEATVVKLVDSFSSKVILVFFIKPGQTVEYTIPSGSYIIKVATGSTWYGATYLFGEDMRASRLDGVQVFNPDEGWTYELIPQANGNLGQETIDAEDF